jgi:integrase/recombinase XerD
MSTWIQRSTSRSIEITRLHDAEVSLRTIQKRTGYASLANLAFYIEVDQEDVDAADELL